MGRHDTYFGDCKSPYSAPANCKFAGTRIQDLLNHFVRMKKPLFIVLYLVIPSILFAQQWEVVLPDSVYLNRGIAVENNTFEFVGYSGNDGTIISMHDNGQYETIVFPAPEGTRLVLNNLIELDDEGFFVTGTLYDIGDETGKLFVMVLDKNFVIVEQRTIQVMVRPMKTERGTQWRTYYSLTDHLGNVRAEFVAHDSGQPELVQQTDYYPFGYTLRCNDFGSQHPNRRLFGGKELQDETIAGNTLDWYDFEARMYDPVIGRFLTTDPMAEKYFSLTPYGYCVNNPMNYIDPSGKDVEISIDKENKTILVRANFYYNSSQLEQSDRVNIKERFQNAMNIWSENIKTAFDNKHFDGYSVNVQFEWKEVDIGEATGIDAIKKIEQAAKEDPIGNSIVHIEETNPRSEVKGSKYLKANMQQAAADSYLYFETDGNTAMHEIGHFFGLRDRYVPTNPEHASYIEGDLMTKNPPRENAVKPFVRIIDYNNLTPEESKTIFINKNNREPK